MPTFETDKGALLWNATAVPNAFFCEYMPSAPEGHVKVYLYGLMCAGTNRTEEGAMLDDMARALNMARSEVEQAFRYWERCRLVERVKDQPPLYRFLSIQQALMRRQAAPRDDAYEAFAQAVYAAFGDKRKLHGGETVLAYEWVEQLKLPPEIVLMLIQHMIATRGVQFSFKEAQKLAAELSEQQITTIEAAETLFSRSEAAWKGARKVLNRLGKRRSPSMDEIDLYVKWTTEWAFTPKAIESACAETVKGDPSFAYLNGILAGIRERSGGRTTSAEQVVRQLETENDEVARVREVLVAFGMKAPIVDAGKRALYRDMQSKVEHEVVLLAAGQIGMRRGPHSIDDVVRLVDAWQQKGLTTEALARAHLDRVAAQDKRLKEIHAAAGKEGGCTQSNREMLAKWCEQWKVSDELISIAAEYARDAERPMPYIDKLLSSWREEGITTAEGAREQHARFTANAANRGGTAQGGAKKVLEQQYTQREYDPNEVNGMSAEDIEEALKL